MLLIQPVSLSLFFFFKINTFDQSFNIRMHGVKIRWEGGIKKCELLVSVNKDKVINDQRLYNMTQALVVLLIFLIFVF